MQRETLLKRRLDRVRRALKEHRLPALLVSRRANVAYLTGFTGSAGTALVTGEATTLIVDFRYFEQAQLEAPGCRLLHVAGSRYAEAIALAVQEAAVLTLAYEADDASVADYMGLESSLAGVRLVPSRGLVELARERKDPLELAQIRRAASITSQAVEAALMGLAPGVSERELAGEIERHARRFGADGWAFETLVAFGDRAAQPHPRPGDRVLAPGDWVLVDAGVRSALYCSDMTRCFVQGPASTRQREAWDAVRAALEAGLAAVRPGVRAASVDAACRQALQSRGWEAGFGHDAGHGVGLEIHEAPRLAADSDDVLVPGMVVTVEPGVYLPGWGGCRLEELVLVTPDGAEVLTTAPLSPTSLCTLPQ